jgi:hypothetical protein
MVKLAPVVGVTPAVVITWALLNVYLLLTSATQPLVPSDESLNVAPLGSPDAVSFAE